MARVKLNGIRKTFGADTHAVRDVSLEFADGELTALLGPSGCGKTTLLRIIAGLESATRGDVLLDGTLITDQPAHQRRFGMVFQSFALFPHMNVLDNVAYSLSISGMERRLRHARAKELLDLVQLADFGKRRIGELSGGQRQRVAIARALAQEPRVFLLDEPMSALDAKLREEMQVELRLLQQRLGITTIVVTHDQREAMTIADRIVIMSDGQVEQIGNPQDVYARPASEFVASFIGKANFLSGSVTNGSIQTCGTLLRVDPPPSFIEGAPVTVVCRPEAIALSFAKNEGTNQLPGKITFVRDVGPTREVFVEAVQTRLVCEIPRTDKREMTVGNDVLVDLPPEALQIFPGTKELGEAA